MSMNREQKRMMQRQGAIGADGAPIAGWTTQVEQKAGTSTTLFRVGIAEAEALFQQPRFGRGRAAPAAPLIAPHEILIAKQAIPIFSTC